MPTFKTYLTLLRVSNLPTVWSNVLTAALLCNAPFSWITLIVLMLSLSLFYCGGMAFNDICDADIDLLQRPSRPIPAHRITRRAASLLTLMLFICAFALLLATPHQTSAIIAGALLLACILFYDLFHKGNPASVMVMAACRAMVYVVAGYAITETVNQALMVIATIQFGYIILVSLTARYENNLKAGFAFPMIPFMLAGICLIDGIYLAVTLSSYWLVVGAGGMVLTLFGQRFVRGD